MRVQFNLSVTPFCSGVLGIVYSWCIPSDFRYDSNFFDVYSPPLSDRIVFSLFPLDFSASAFHSTKYSKA